MTTRRQIDAHVHFWKVARGDYSWMTQDLTALYRDFGPNDLLPHLRASGVDAVILVQAAETVAETEFLLATAEKTDFVAGVVGWADMESVDFAGTWARLSANRKLKGVRPMIQEKADPDWMLGERLTPAFHEIVASGATFDLLIKPPHLDAALKLLFRHPELRAVIDHGAKPQIGEGKFSEWAAGIRRLAAETSAYCKLSGLVTEAGSQWSLEQLRPFVDHLLNSFGPERVMFGSDWPVLTLASDYPTWRTAASTLLTGLTERQRQGVFGDNAARFYRL